MTDFSAKKNRNGAKSIPTWSGRQEEFHIYFIGLYNF